MASPSLFFESAVAFESETQDFLSQLFQFLPLGQLPAAPSPDSPTVRLLIASTLDLSSLATQKNQLPTLYQMPLTWDPGSLSIQKDFFQQSIGFFPKPARKALGCLCWKILFPQSPKILYKRSLAAQWKPGESFPVLIEEEKKWGNLLQPLIKALKQSLNPPFSFSLEEEDIGTEACLLFTGQGFVENGMDFFKMTLPFSDFSLIEYQTKTGQGWWTWGYLLNQDTQTTFNSFSPFFSHPPLSSLKAISGLKKNLPLSCHSLSADFSNFLEKYQKEFREIQLEIRKIEIKIEKLKQIKNYQKIIKTKEHETLWLAQLKDLNQKLEAWIGYSEKIKNRLENWIKDHPHFFKKKE